MKIKKLNESMNPSLSSRIFGAKGKQLKSQFSESINLNDLTDHVKESMNEASQGFQKEFYNGYVILRNRAGDGWDIYSYDGTPERVTKVYLEDEGFASLQAAKDEIDKWYTTNESIEETKESDDLISVEQEFDSAATSINSNKLPAVYSMVKFNPGDVVVDYGGGKFDNAVNYLKDQDVTLLVYDPYNRSAEHNKEVLRVLREHGGADAAINSNVLNVIKEPEARNAVLQNIKKITKKGAPIYITVYEGTGKGNEGPTGSGYQLNRKTADYMDEIGQVFSNLSRKEKLITAINEAYEGKDAHNEKVTLYYDDLEVQVGHGDGNGYYDWGIGGWLPDGDDRTITVSYEYNVDKNRVLDHIDYLIYKEDPDFTDKFETDEEYEKYLEDNFDDLFDKYEEKILDKFRDDAKAHAEENGNFNESLKEASTSDKILYVIKDKNGNQLSAPNPDDSELWDRVESMEAHGRRGLSVVAYVNKPKGPYIRLSDPQAYVDELDFAGAVEINGDKVYADEETLRQLANAILAEYGWKVKINETQPITEAYEGTYSDKFRALAKKYHEDAPTKDALLVLTNNIIRYCPEEDLKDLWAKYSKYYEKDLNESVTEASEDIISGPASGMAAVMSNLIKDEYDAIDGYNSAIVTAEAQGYEDAVRVLAEIQAEENIHVGQLQEIMKLFDPNADKVEDGRVEGEEQLANPVAAE